MADTTRNVDIQFNTNAEQVENNISSLGREINATEASTTRATGTIKGHTEALRTNSISVLDNGGAMGILNTLTGGYAQIVKDAVEASQLFTKSTNAATVANEAGVLVEQESIAVTNLATVATAQETTATIAATVATNTWTAALLANPLVAITALVVGLGVAVYAVSKYFIDEAADLKELNNVLEYSKIKNDNLNRSIKEGQDTRAGMNTIEIARARALGASSKEIDILIQKQKDLDVQLAFSATQLARQNQLQAQDDARKALSNGDEESIKKSKENLKASTDLYNSYNKEYDKAIVDSTVTRLGIIEKGNNAQRDLNKKRNDDILKQNEKANAEQKAINDKRQAEEFQLAQKAVEILNQLKYGKETPGQKERREFEEKKAILEANNLSIEELEAEHQIKMAILDNPYASDERAKARQDALRQAVEIENEIRINAMKNLNEQELAFIENDKINKLNDEAERFNNLTIDQQKEEEQIRLHKAIIEEIRTTASKATNDKEIEIENASAEQKNEIRQRDLDNIQNGLGVINTLFGKNKVIQKASMVAEGALSIGKQIVATNVANAGALASPANIAVPGAALPIIAANNTAKVIGIASTVAATAKAISSIGGGGGVSSGSGASDSAVVSASAKPNSDFIKTPNTQLADSINQDKDQRPIKTYVVASEVGTQLELERNAIIKATLG